jgi:hypothetical protein
MRKKSVQKGQMKWNGGRGQQIENVVKCDYFNPLVIRKFRPMLGDINVKNVTHNLHKRAPMLRGDSIEQKKIINELSSLTFLLTFRAWDILVYSSIFI